MLEGLSSVKIWAPITLRIQLSISRSGFLEDNLYNKEAYYGEYRLSSMTPTLEMFLNYNSYS